MNTHFENQIFSQEINHLKPKAIQLVSLNQNSKELQLTEEGKQFLININQPISVITIAGLYRTGKSYLVNQFVKQTIKQNKNQGFKVGSTIQSVTKGLNVWSIPIPAHVVSYQENQQVSKSFYYLVIDSEGIGSMEQEVAYDINLLMLIFLISSTVIYNSQGAIDQQSLDQLRVVINMKKCLNSSQNQPKFIWVLRDFALQLMNKNGSQMSQNQYLEFCLQEAVTKNKQLMKKNQIRKAIKQNLKNRSCYTLVRPTLDQADLGDLQNIQKKKLREQFLEGIQRLKDDVFSNQITDIKTVNSSFVNGPILSQLIQSYLNEINCNKVPQIQSIWDMIVSNQIQQLIQECIEVLRAKTQQIEIPLSQFELKMKLNQIENKIFSQFQNKIINESGRTYKKFHGKFMKQVQRINQKIKKNNNQMIRSKKIKELKHFINNSIKLDTIQPYNLIDFKIQLEKIVLRANDDPQAYGLIFRTIYSVLQICHNKSQQIVHENCQLKNLFQNQTYLRKNSQLQLMTIKKEYHQMLKDISDHQTRKLQLDQTRQCLGQQNKQLKKRIVQIQSQIKQKTLFYENRILELQSRQKQKNQQYNNSIKILRQQNNQMTQQIQQLKNQLLALESKQRKQIIFEEKIQGTWKIFQEQRTFFKNQLQKYKQKYFSQQENFKQLQIKFQTVVQSQKIDKEKAIQKQKQFIKQLQWMKQNYMENKKVFMNTYNTIAENDKILKQISGNASNHQKNIQNIAKISEKNILQAKNKQMQEIANLQQKQRLINQINQLKSLNDKLQQKLRIQSSKEQKFQKLFKKMKEQKQIITKRFKALQEQYQKEKQRFGNSLSLIQQAKNQQRSIYEQSILKLIDNIQKGMNLRQSQISSKYSSKSSFYRK